jgi:hypothetical protein
MKIISKVGQRDLAKGKVMNHEFSYSKANDYFTK